MKNAKLLDILKQGNIVIPLYLLQNYDKLKLNLDEFIFLMYLYNQGEEFVFNPSKIGASLSMGLIKVMDFISKLTDKHFIEVKVIKNDKNIMEEYISLHNFYQKLELLLVDEIQNEEKIINSSIFETIEQEFGRTLSPMEYEIIKAWLENNMSEELIKEALKEATFNGVSNLRYIDKILYEWAKKGFKTADDVRQHQKNYKEEKQQIQDVFDYDWLEDGE